MGDKETIENLPVFASPCRIFEMNKDPINQKCKRILGNYETMQSFISDFIYISSEERPEILHYFPNRRLDVSYRGIGPFSQYMQPNIEVTPMIYQKKSFSLVSVKNNSNVTQVTPDIKQDKGIQIGGNHKKCDIIQNIQQESRQPFENITPTSFKVAKTLNLNNPIKPKEIEIDEHGLIRSSDQIIRVKESEAKKDIYCKPQQTTLDVGVKMNPLQERNVEDIFNLTIVKSALKPFLSPIYSPVYGLKNNNQVNQTLTIPSNNKLTVSLQTVISEIINTSEPLSPIQSPKRKSIENDSLEPITKNIEPNVLQPHVNDLISKQNTKNDFEERHILESWHLPSSIAKESSDKVQVPDYKNTSLVSICASSTAQINGNHKDGIEKMHTQLYEPKEYFNNPEIISKAKNDFIRLDNIAKSSFHKERKSENFSFIEGDNEKNKNSECIKHVCNSYIGETYSRNINPSVDDREAHADTMEKNEPLKEINYTDISETQNEQCIKVIAKEIKEIPKEEKSLEYPFKTDHTSTHTQASSKNSFEISPFKIMFAGENVFEKKALKDENMRQVVAAHEFIKPDSTGSYQRYLNTCLDVERNKPTTLTFSSLEYKKYPFDFLNSKRSAMRLPIYSFMQREKKFVIKIPIALLDKKLELKLKSRFHGKYQRRTQHSHFTRKKSICIMVKIKTILLYKLPYSSIYKDVECRKTNPYIMQGNTICSEDIFNKNCYTLGSELLKNYGFNDSNSYIARANYLKDQAEIMKPTAQKFLKLMSAMWYIMCSHRMEEENITINNSIMFFLSNLRFLEEIDCFDDSRIETLKLLLKTAVSRRVYLLKIFQMKQLQQELTEESMSTFGSPFPSQQFTNYIQQHFNTSKNENDNYISVSKHWLSANNDYVEIMEFLVRSNQFWLDSQYLMQENMDFFSQFKNKGQMLSLNGTIPLVVDFVKDCLEILQPKELKIYTEFQKYIKYENGFI